MILYSKKSKRRTQFQKQAIESVKNTIKIFENVNVDLIPGLPGPNIRIMAKDLRNLFST